MQICHLCKQPLEKHNGILTCMRHCSPEKEYNTNEYVPIGPARVITRDILNISSNVNKFILPTYGKSSMKLGFIASKAKPGWLYDMHTGLQLGPASDEEKEAHRRNEPWERIIAGMKQLVVIG